MSIFREQNLKIKADGHLKQTLKEGGGSLRFTSWKGTKLVDDETLELCEGLDMFGQECPIEAGHLSVSEDIPLWEEEDLPEVSRIASSHHGPQVRWNAITNDLCLSQGTFYVQINVTTAHEQQITCFGGKFTL